MNVRVPLHEVCMLKHDRLFSEETVAMRLVGSALQTEFVAM
jgi:hypothetical protein